MRSNRGASSAGFLPWLGLAVVGVLVGAAIMLDRAPAPERPEVSAVDRAVLSSETPTYLSIHDADPSLTSATVFDASGEGLVEVFKARAGAVSLCETLTAHEEMPMRLRVDAVLDRAHGDYLHLLALEAPETTDEQTLRWLGCLEGVFKPVAFENAASDRIRVRLDVDRSALD